VSVFDQLIDQKYEEACNRGLRLVGESADFFAQRRIEVTRKLCGSVEVATVIDFGCGLGHTAPHLRAAFPTAAVIGVDESDKMISAARQHHSQPHVEFWCGSPPLRRPADLVYCNGVLHHIPPADRLAALRQVSSWMRVGGLFALWENNPRNPGTRLVMSRIPFDREATMLTSREARVLAAAAGFTVLQTTFWFFFPRALKALRPLEPRLQRVPLGGQYCVFGRKAS